MTKLEWKRAKVELLATGKRRTWVSRNGHYKVEEYTERPGRLPDRYLAWCQDVNTVGTVWRMLSEHKKEQPARDACQAEHSRREREAAAHAKKARKGKNAKASGQG